MPLPSLLLLPCLLLLPHSLGLSPEERALGAILGSFTADAATMPLHWIYDTSEIDSLLDGAQPEFFPTPSCHFYNYPFGENSPYGQQTRQLLARAAADLTVDPMHIEEQYWRFYGARDGECSDTAKCYHDGSTKGFMANHAEGRFWPECGANDTQANAIAHMVVVAAAWAGKPGMLEKVETAIRVTQNTEDAVAFGSAAARILEKVILGSAGRAAVEGTIFDLVDPDRDQPHEEDTSLAAKLTEVLTKLSTPNFDIVQEVGQSCEYPDNLISGAHLIAQAPGYVDGVRQRILSGGDQASANSFIGAVLGALGGVKDIPDSWKAQYTHYDTVLAQAEALLHGVRNSDTGEAPGMEQMRAEMMTKMEEIHNENAALRSELAAVKLSSGSPSALACAYNTGAWSTADSTVIYDRLLSEHYSNGGDGRMDLESGTYTCQTAGHYTVTVSGLVALNPGAVAWVYVHRSGELVEESSIGGFVGGGGGYLQFQGTRTMIVRMEAGDTLEVRTDTSEYFTGDLSYVTFCVSLTAPDV